MDQKVGQTTVAVPTAIRRGLRVRWLMWSILALSYFIVYFHRVAPGVVADRLMAEFAVGGAAVGLLTAIYLYVYAAMQVPAGLLADSLGVRRTVTIGTLLTAVGSLLFGLAPTLEVSYLGRFLVGLGVSVVFVSTLKFQSNWFSAGEFGTVSGLLLLTGGLGGIAATTPTAALAQWLGWRLSFVIIGAITAAVAAAAWHWVRERPSDLGLPPPHGSLPPAGAGARTSPVAVKKLPFRAGVAKVWRNRQTWAGLVSQMGLSGPSLAMIGLWGVPFLMNVYGFDRMEAANHLLATSTGMLISAPLAGRISDRLRRRRLPIMALATLSCVVWMSLAFWNGGKPPEWALYPLFAALGVGQGNVTVTLSAVKEANPPNLSGLAMGTANNGFLCAAFLQPGIGYLLDRYWQGAMQDGARVYPAEGYHVALMVLAGLALIGWLAAVSMRETHCRNVAEA